VFLCRGSSGCHGEDLAISATTSFSRELLDLVMRHQQYVVLNVNDKNFRGMIRLTIL
jgi:hypothetical protein